MKTILLCLCIGIALFRVTPVQAQCTTRVTHLSGTELVDCTNVTVTAEGGTSSTTACSTYPVFPYWVGLGPTGSYTFAFDPPISGFTLDLYGLNNTNGDQEEVVMEINGTLTPFTDAGVGTGCLQPTVLFGGAIRACVDCLGSGRDIHVNQSITTLKIENTVLSGGPNGTVFSLFICCGSCTTDAGVLSGGPFSLCPEQTATLPSATQTELEPDDVLQYILFSNLNDTLGSVVATNNTAPVFSFNPATMSFGLTYYIAAVAANNLNGSVNPNDPCLDFSNAVEVVWHPLPTVTLGLDNNQLCAGECTNVNVTFTGEPPFSMQYSVPWGTFTLSSATPNTVVQLCAPAGTPTGPVSMQALSVTDANCVCN